MFEQVYLGSSSIGFCALTGNIPGREAVIKGVIKFAVFRFTTRPLLYLCFASEHEHVVELRGSFLEVDDGVQRCLIMSLFCCTSKL